MVNRYVATLLLVAVTGRFLYNTVLKDTRNAVIGIVLLLASLPFYADWARRRKTTGSSG